MPTRRLLLISAYFGKHGPTGGFRWAAMSEQLGALGWHIDVIARLPGTDGVAAPLHRQYDPALGELREVWTPRLSEFPGQVLDRVRAMKHAPPRPAPEAARAPVAAAPVDPASVRLWTPPANRSLLSRSIIAAYGAAAVLRELAWNAAAVREGMRLAARHRYDAVICSSPPHLTQLAGLTIAQRIGVPFLADRRDPSILGIKADDQFSSDAVAADFERRAELRLLREATALVHNTDRAREWFESHAPAGSRARHFAVANGYDAAIARVAPDRNVFRGAFTGWLHPVMDVRIILSAFGRLRARRQLSASQLEFCFMGTGDEFGGVPLRGLAAAYGLGEHVRLMPRASRDEALRLQQSCAVLCALDYAAGLAMPMKFYDYAQMCGTMLLVSKPDSAVSAAAARLGLPTFTGTDEAAIDRFLDDAYLRWQRGEMTSPLDAHGMFDRRHQTTRMHELLLELVG